MGNVYYSEYLELGKILDAQHPITHKKELKAHDEMLFIITHQTYELWFKQILFELSSICQLFSGSAVAPESVHTANHRLTRVIEILKILSGQIKIMETMTALDFMEFRDELVPASGFQSLQFRLFEATLGLKTKFRLSQEKVFFNSRLKKEDLDQLTEKEKEISLLEHTQNWLERMPFSQADNFDFWKLYQEVVEKMLKSDEKLIDQNTTLSPEQKTFEIMNLKSTKENFSFLFDDQKYNELVKAGKVRLSRKAKLNALFIYLYREQPLLTPAFDYLNNLVEIDEMITTWRYQHSMMAHRLLGTKIGTGGSSGSDYLKKAAENNRIFIDLFDMATFLIPRGMRPALPKNLVRNLSFLYE